MSNVHPNFDQPSPLNQNINFGQTEKQNQEGYPQNMTSGAYNFQKDLGMSIAKPSRKRNETVANDMFKNSFNQF